MGANQNRTQSKGMEPAGGEITPPGHVRRYTFGERAEHWSLAISYILAALSGLVFFHAAFFGFSSLFGGGILTRILHPLFGIVAAVSFGLFARGNWRRNILDSDDRLWLSKAFEYMQKKHSGIPGPGRYNAGEKMVFWAMLVSLSGLAVTGFVIWRSITGMLFPAWLHRIAVVLHDLFACVMYFGIIVHAYAGIWTKGALTAILRGYVSESWAKKHHPRWNGEVSKK